MGRSETPGRRGRGNPRSSGVLVEAATRPEVHRRDLRDLLLDSVPATAIRWGSKVVEVNTGPDKSCRQVRLADGTTFTADLLIGADGAWSRVRPFVSDATPAYVGLAFAEPDLLDPDVNHPHSAELVGNGLMFALGDGRGFLAHREPDRLHVYAALRTGPTWSAGDITKDDLLVEFRGWDDRLLRLIHDADTAPKMRPIHALPVGHRWERVPGVALLGDAAHLMSPFGGEGANVAMQDAAELAAALIANPHDTEAALTAYESALFPRAERAAAGSAQNLEIVFALDAPDALVTFFKSMADESVSGSS